MKPEYRSLDPLGRTDLPRETIASLLADPVTETDRTRSIGELARECDVTLRALRFYEGKGLLTPTRDGVARLYGAADVRRLRLVLRLKRIGFSLVEIRELLELLLGPGDRSARLAVLAGRIEAQVEILEDQRREIARSLEAAADELDEIRAIPAG